MVTGGLVIGMVEVLTRTLDKMVKQRYFNRVLIGFIASGVNISVLSKARCSFY